MNTTADHVVVGAGITGAAVAAHLAGQGARPLVLEAKEIHAAGATGSSGGMVRAYDPDPVVARLTAASLATYADPAAWFSGQAPLHRVGAVTVAGPEHEDVFARAATALRARQQECQVVNGEHEVLGVHTAGGVALVEPGAGWVDPVSVTDQFLRQAVADGATVSFGTKVNRLTATDTGVLVHTDRDTVHATRSVLLAVGGWAVRPLAKAGIQIRTRAIQTAVVRRPPEVPLHASFIDLRTGAYGRPNGDGTSLVGSPLLVWDIDPDRPVPPDSRHQERTVEAVAANLPWSRATPPLKSTRSFDAFTGADDLLVATELPKVWTCRPGNGEGVKVAPELGRAIALLLSPN